MVKKVKKHPWASPAMQGYKSRQNESQSARLGARGKLKRKVSAKGRRAEGAGPRKAAGGKKYGLKSKKVRI